MLAKVACQSLCQGSRAITVAVCESSGLLPLQRISGDSLMLYHILKPCYRKFRDTWCVEIDGRHVSLGEDCEVAYQRCHSLSGLTNGHVFSTAGEVRQVKVSSQ